jgi:hypothetical protein
VSNVDVATWEATAKEMMEATNAFITAAVQLAATSGQPEAVEDLEALQKTFLEPLSDA